MNALKKVVSRHSRRSSSSSQPEDRPSRDAPSSPLTPASPRVSKDVPRLPSESAVPLHSTAGRTSLDGAQRDLGRMNLNQDAREGGVGSAGGAGGAGGAGVPSLPAHEHEASRGLGSKLSQAILDHPSTEQDHQTLAPVVHHRIHHHETEIVTKHREVENHIHHVQHHVQPLIEEVHNEEKHYQQSHPITEEYEEKSNTAEDRAFFALLNKQKFTETHICEERIIIDNGEKVRQTVHYHVHNVIQPVIYRDRPIPSTCVPASAALSSTRHSLAPQQPLSSASPRAGSATLNANAGQTQTKTGGLGHGVPVGQGQAGEMGLAR